MANQKIQYTEEMVGENHPQKADTLNRLTNVEHNDDGTHSDITVTTITVPNSGLHLLDTNASHDLIIKPGSDLDADRILTLITGNAARTLTFEDDAIVSQDYSVDANPQFAGLNDGTYNIDIPTNGMAAAKFMLGNSNTIIWMYLNTAPPGWKALATGADTVLGVSGGAQAYNINGGTAGGTWTQPNHAHTGPSHTHPAGTLAGPSHTHPQNTGGVSNLSTPGGNITAASASNTVMQVYTDTAGSGLRMYTGVSAGGTGAVTGSTNSGGTGATGGDATVATYRPSASVGKLFQLDTA